MNSLPSRGSGPRRVRGQPSSCGSARRRIEAIRAQSRQLLTHGLHTIEDIPEWAEHHQQYSAYSFDVFDTLLRRMVDPPDEVKSLVAQHICERMGRRGILLDAGAILAERDRVERGLQEAAKSRGLDAVAHLDDIMAGTLKSIGAAGIISVADIVQHELAVEKAATDPMPGVRHVLTFLQSKHRRIIAVSETYLSAAQLSSILEHHDLLHFLNGLYVSCDLGRSKATGNLFRHVLEHEGQTVHIGDHYTFDYVIPKRLGIKALWFHSRDELRRKRELRTLASRDNRLAYVNGIVGSPRLERKDGLYELGHDVIGPALTVFVHVVAERARRENVDRVFFVARDGFALKKIYNVLQRSIYAGNSVPSARYLCLSRLVVRRAYLSARGLLPADVAKAFRYVASRKKDVTLLDILTSHGLEPEQFQSLIARHGLDTDSSIQDPADAKIRALLEDRQFGDTVMAVGHTARQLLRQYLKDAGFLGADRVAIVDATSEGLTQALLSEVFHDDADYPGVRGYYFTLLNLGVDDAHDRRDASAALGIVNDWRTDDPAAQADFRRFGLLVELFSHPNHGLTTGYRTVDGRTLPVFRRTSQESQYERTSQALEGIVQYARKYGARYSLHNFRCEDLVADVRTSIGQWLRSPPIEHVRAVRGLFVVSDWPIENRYPLTLARGHTRVPALVRHLIRSRSA